MASTAKNNRFETKDTFAVHGYVRDNFEDNCWVQEIIQIIIHFYISDSGSLYVCGNGEFGKLGIEEYNHKICKILTVCPPFDEFNALDVAVGGYHTSILDIDGQVWNCGDEDYNHSEDDGGRNIYSPEMLSLIQPAVAVAAGNSFSLILLKNGTVQSFGNGLNGVLGHGNEDDLFKPKTIKALQHIKIMQIAAAGFSSACLTENGQLFCFGDNSVGACGIGKDKGEHITTPTKIKFEGKVDMVECGGQHILLFANTHLLYSFGFGTYGQLGHGNDKNKYIPALIEALKHVDLHSCGAGSFHSICVDVSGTVWGFGCNTDGECGLGNEIENQWTPKVIEYFVVNKIKAVDCAAGGYQSAVISEHGDLYVFGNNLCNQLGLEETNYFTPTKLPLSQNMRVKKISMSSEHSAVILG